VGASSRVNDEGIMTVELVLAPIAEKPFAQVYPFQLFQLPQQSEIWVKVSASYARIISQKLSIGKSFQPDEIVILLSPYSIAIAFLFHSSRPHGNI
jgi:hypothetical protein